MFLTACAELVLVAALIATLRQLSRVHIGQSEAPQAGHCFLLLMLSLSTIALTALVGALRYYALTPEAPTELLSMTLWGWHLNTLHDGLSTISRTIAMPIYLATTVWLWGRLPRWVAPGLLVIALLPQFGWISLFTDAAIVMMLLALLQHHAARRFVWLALGCLLAVPLSVLFIHHDDIALATFHGFLALHFLSYTKAIPMLATTDAWQKE